MVRIIDFEEKYAGDFRRLNLEWLDQYALTESHDLEVLDNPMGIIVQPGGAIFLAIEDDLVIGTAALLKEKNFEFELVKMFVAKEYRGRGISKLLIEKMSSTGAEARREPGFSVFQQPVANSHQTLFAVWLSAYRSLGRPLCNRGHKNGAFFIALSNSGTIFVFVKAKLRLCIIVPRLAGGFVFFSCR